MDDGLLVEVERVTDDEEVEGLDESSLHCVKSMEGISEHCTFLLLYQQNVNTRLILAAGRVIKVNTQIYLSVDALKASRWIELKTPLLLSHMMRAKLVLRISSNWAKEIWD